MSGNRLNKSPLGLRLVVLQLHHFLGFFDRNNSLFFQNENSRTHRVIFIVIFVGLFTESAGRYYGSRGVNDSWIYNFGFLYLETILLWLYFFVLFRKGSYRKALILAIVLFSVWFGINSFFIQGFWNTFQTYTVFISSLSIIFCCFWFFIPWW